MLNILNCSLGGIKVFTFEIWLMVWSSSHWSVIKDQKT